MLVFSEGRAADRLRVARQSDEAAAAALVARVHPGCTVEPAPGMSLWEGTYPPDGTSYAASFDGVEVVCDRRLMGHRPSLMPSHLLAAGRGDRVFFHAMHSVSDALTFAVWEGGVLVRSLSLSPDSGIVENIGAPYAFEAPFWAGERPVGSVSWWARTSRRTRSRSIRSNWARKHSGSSLDSCWRADSTLTMSTPMPFRCKAST
ncbi:DUF6928 family protein [Streptacidiphilus jeojiensis]|uniref:DUF6928 family protein n=1 Tax=Streptacidiphilus jeojiensis TaxID=3229225 RepID=UPI0036D21EAF